MVSAKLGAALVLAAAVVLTQAQIPAFRATANEVRVDLVVTGRHGRVVKNLKASQVELFDNGHRRAITSFRLVSRSVHLPGATLRRLGIPPALRPQPFNLIVFVFGNVNSLGRSLARRSALWYLKHEMGPADYGAVFASGAGLHALTPFTRNRVVLDRAVSMASGGTSAPRQDVLTAEQQIERGIGSPAQAMPAAEGSNFNRYQAGHATAGGAGAIAAALTMIIEHATAAGNAESSWSSLTALRSLVQALGLLPGRKEVIYYSQWLDINPTTVFMFRAVMHDANRNHVSFYPVDPAGLSITSSASRVTSALLQAGGTNPLSPGLSPGPGEAIENVTYAGRLSALSELAGATGGFLSARTNDLRPFMAKIAADVSDHYELTYNPGPLSGTAAFHSITIEIPGHAHWHVRTRKGYYVLPRLPDPVPDGLTPLLVALASPRPPHALALTAAAFAFPRGVDDARVWSEVQVPLGDLDAEPPSAGDMKKNPLLRGRQIVRFGLLQMVEDGQGQTVTDAAKQFGFAVPRALMPRAWAGPWTHQLTLPPGAYMLQAGIYQAQSKKTAVLVCPFLVPPSGPVRLGTIAVVQTVRGLPHAPAGFDPWWYQNVEVVPNLTGVLPASSDPGRSLGFYFLAQVPPGATGAKVRMAFSRAGRIFVQTPPFPLPAPDAGGEIRFLANIPLRTFPPGRYQATVTILAVGRRASSAVSFQTIAMPSN